MRLYQKIVFGYTVILMVILLVIFPIVPQSANAIVMKILKDRVHHVIHTVKKSDSLASLVDALRQEAFIAVFRSTLFNEKGEVLFDSQAHNIENYEEKYLHHTIDAPEIEEAIIRGHGYREGYSTLFRIPFVYVATRFSSHGEKYVLRMAFPQRQMRQINTNFEKGFLLLASTLIIVFSALTLTWLSLLIRPLRKMIACITPYEQGNQAQLPHIDLDARYQNSEFGHLASLLNELNARVQKQFNQLCSEAEEKKITLDTLNEGVISFDIDHHILYLNFTAYQLLEIRKELGFRETLEKLLSLTHPTLSGAIQTLLNRLHSGDSSQEELVDLGSRQLILVATPKKEGGGYILIVRDGSSNMRIVQMGKEFIAHASHELRTPLTITKGYAEALQQQLSEEQKRLAIEKIVGSCDRMNLIIRNSLILAEIEHLPRYKVRDYSLLEIVNSAISSVRDAYPDMDCVLEHDSEPIIVKGDKELLTLAFRNLIENGAKYAKEKPFLRIQIRRGLRHTIVEVEDRGVGIESHEVPHIFERFYRGKHKKGSKRVKGSGLGLSLVKTIFDQHLINVEVSSEVDIGTRFKCRIPLPEERDASKVE